MTSAGVCCCDPDCTKKMVRLGKDAGAGRACLPEGKLPDETSICAAVLNADAGLVERVEGSALCVVKKNSALIGNFYNDPWTSGDKVKKEEVTGDASNGWQLEATVVTGGTTKDPFGGFTFARSNAKAPEVGGYYPGDAILSVTGVAARTAFCGTKTCIMGLPLPSAGAGGSCDFGNAVQFGVSDSKACTNVLPAPTAPNCAKQSASALLPKTFSKRKKVKTPAAIVYSYQNADGSAATTPATSALSGGTCTNVIVAVDYKITIDSGSEEEEDDGTDSDAEVEKVEALVTVGVQKAADRSMPLTSTVAFYDTVKNAVPSGFNAAADMRSGSLGYQTGKPVVGGKGNVIAAKDTDTKFTVQERIGGLKVMGAGAGGECKKEASVVRFGYDSVIACIEKGVTYAAFEAQCTATKSYTWWASNHETNDTFVATFARASSEAKPLNWIAVVPEEEDPKGGDFDATTSTCNGMVTGLDYVVYTTPIGNALIAQDKIVAVTRRYSTGTRSFSGAAVTQDIELRTTVSFMELPDNVAVEKVLPAPKIIPELPADLFYPFDLSSA